MHSPKVNFPVELKCQWQTETTHHLSTVLNNWLFDKGSLTSRLKSISDKFHVELLGQHIEPCQPHEANSYIHENSDVLVREVLLYCDDKAHVFARSLIPLTSLTGDESQLANLGTQPLGQVLFNNPKLKRQQISVAEFSKTSRVGLIAAKLGQTVTQPLWGRRSIFLVEDKPLSVAEVFLPVSHAYNMR